MNKRYIITGAPGTGKTSLINALKQQGHSCYDEVSRKIIIKQQKIGNDKTPWGDLSGFVNLVYQQTIKELNIPVKQNTFVDRGLPDSIAYLRARSYKVPEYLVRFPFETYYESTIFLAPPWEEIYANDPQRPQSSQEAFRIHKYLVEVYQSLHFSIKILPKEMIEKRIDFIQSIIHKAS